MVSQYTKCKNFERGSHEDGPEEETKTQSECCIRWPGLHKSPDFNLIEMVWDELDCREKEKQPTSAQHMWELLRDSWKSIPCESGLENANSVQSCHQGKVWLLWRISNWKYILICLTVLVTTWFDICYFTVLMSSVLFYNVENSTNKENTAMSRCVQTFDWYCVRKVQYLRMIL